jgi:L-methionine (R)-S-oxide reductase
MILQTPPAFNPIRQAAAGRSIVCDMNDPESVEQAWLREYLRSFQGAAGTVHVRQGDELVLAAAVNIPPKVEQIVRRIPRGKGMAGLAFEQDAPISTCNVKDDATGRVRPGAKLVDAGAGVALPVHDAAGRVRAVVGIAFAEQRELSESELAALGRSAGSLPASA